MLGIGIGILIGTFFTLISEFNYTLNDGQIEMKARKLGMTYPNEIRVMIKDEVK